VSEYQPRWLAYSRATGTAPDKVKGYEFIIWIGQQLQAWRAETGYSGTLLSHHHEAFDRWLVEQTTGSRAA